MDSRDDFRLRAYAAEMRIAELEAENAALREHLAEANHYNLDKGWWLRKRKALLKEF